jgi:hypothetical protein
MKKDRLITLITAIAVIMEEVFDFFSKRFGRSEDDQDQLI